MITLIQDGIEVKAESLTDAKRALTKASKLAKKQNELRRKNTETAQTIADHNCYRMMANMSQHNEMPRAWKLYPIGDAYGDCERLPESDDEGRTQYKITSWSSDGPNTATAAFYSSDVILGQICNSQGVIGLHVRWSDFSEQIIGVGMCNGEFAFSVAYGINASMFPTRQN